MKKFKTGITALDSQLDGVFQLVALFSYLRDQELEQTFFPFHFALEV